MADLITIDDRNWQEHLPDEILRPGGLTPRDYGAYPMFYSGETRRWDLPLIPFDAMPEWIRWQDQQQSSLYHLASRAGPGGTQLPFSDQGQWSFCWAHSVTNAMKLSRAAWGQPYVPLSAFSVACPIKNFRNEGGWNLQAVEYAARYGIASEATWPDKGANPAYLTRAMYEDAARHKNTLYYELDPSDPDYVQQYLTALLLNLPVASDFNWWGHSVCGVKLVSIDPRSPVRGLRTRILNSWTGWGENGFGDLVGQRAVPNGATVIATVTASAA